jgi:hypothetical protein
MALGDDGAKATAVPERRLSAARVLERNLMMMNSNKLVVVTIYKQQRCRNKSQQTAVSKWVYD